MPLTWLHTPGVTLLGDAAHVMSLFGGKEANLALLDGCELALAVVKAGSIDAAISAYEEVMLPRAGENAVKSNRALARFFADGAFNPQTDIPNFAEERAQYKSRSAAYRQAAPDDHSPSH